MPENERMLGVKSVKFTHVTSSVDGQMLILRCKDKAGKEAFLGIDWLDIPALLALLDAGVRGVAQARKSLGKSDDINPSKPISRFVVSRYQCNRDENSKQILISLSTENGLRFDFAVPEGGRDELNRPLPEGLAVEIATARRLPYSKDQ